VKRTQTPSIPIPRTALLTAGVVCTCVVVSHIFGRFSFSILLPALRDDLVDSDTAAGTLGATYFAGYMLGVLAVTIVSSRTEPTTLMRAGLGFSVVALVILAGALDVSELAIGLALAGFAGAGIWITAPSIATGRVPTERRGAVLGALTASMGMGMLIVSQGTSLLRKLLDDEGAWRPIFGIEAALTTVILTAALVFLRPTLTRPTVTPPTSGAPTSAATKPATDRPVLFSTQDLRSIPGWALLTLCYTLYSTLAGSWAQFLGLALRQDAGYGSFHVNNLFSVFAVAGVVGPLTLGRVSDRIGRNLTIVIACMLSTIASFVLLIGSEPWSTIAVAAYGAGSFGLPVLVAAAVRDHLDNQAFGTAFGAMTILYGIGSLGASQLAGYLADRTGSFDIVYLLLAAMAILSGAAALVREASMRRDPAGTTLATN